VIFFVGPSTLSRIHTGYLLSKYKPMFTQHQDGRLTVVPIPKGKNAVLRFLYETLSDFYLPYFLQAQIATFQETVRLREGWLTGWRKTCCVWRGTPRGEEISG
jgi:hypothetical protein